MIGIKVRFAEESLRTSAVSNTTSCEASSTPGRTS